MKIPEHVSTALASAEIENGLLRLTGQLDRKTYLDANAVIEALGWKWSRKAKAHEFPDMDAASISEALSETLKSGETETLKEVLKRTNFFPTPKAVAKKLVALAGVTKGDSVLEPSAWTGAIAEEIFGAGAESVVMVEFDAKNVMELQKRFPKKEFPGAVAICGDFLDFAKDAVNFHEGKGRYSKIVMNPPFSNGRDAKHVLAAYSVLAPGGTLVAVMAGSAETKSGADYDAVRSIAEFHALPAGSFKESGTDVATVVAVLKKSATTPRESFDALVGKSKSGKALSVKIDGAF